MTSRRAGIGGNINTGQVKATATDGSGWPSAQNSCSDLAAGSMYHGTAQSLASLGEVSAGEAGHCVPSDQTASASACLCQQASDFLLEHPELLNPETSSRTTAPQHV